MQRCRLDISGVCLPSTSGSSQADGEETIIRVGVQKLLLARSTGYLSQGELGLYML